MGAKFRQFPTLAVAAFAALGLAALLLFAPWSMAASHEDMVTAEVDYVNPERGIVMLRIADGKELKGLRTGDVIEIVVEEETSAMQKQQPGQKMKPRRFRLGPSHP